MTQEDKELLLKDLCTRLPYKVVVETQLANAPRAKYPVLKVLQSYMLCDFMQTIDNVIYKPYLRPISSMTEEERKEIRILIRENRPNPYRIINNDGVDNLLFSVSVTSRLLIDWLNAHHFDYRGLIEKGLAIEAPDGMYEKNDEIIY